MKSPHRVSGRGATIRRHTDTREPSRTTEQRQRAARSPQQRWQSANPKARWAHVALQSAIHRGVIKREPCAVCGAEKVDGHHPNYDRPMDVVWLCRRHHKELHSRERAISGR